MLSLAAVAQPSPSLEDSRLDLAKPSIWRAGVGEGFRPGTRSLSFGLGAGVGVKAFGSQQRHDLALASISYGRMLGGRKEEHRRVFGNLGLRGEVFAGAQFAPSSEWLVGLTPHLRYHFATGTRWIPFLDGGAGVTATSIGPPDLSNTFEFNLQGGPGLHWFAKDNLALTLEVRYIHLSCAGISQPNDGLNNLMGVVSLTWFF